MALNPLANAVNQVTSPDIARKDNGTPLNGGLNPRSATSYIANLLDDSGHTADNIDRTQGDKSSRDLAEEESGQKTYNGLPDDINQNEEEDDTGDNTADDADTDDIEGGDTDIGDQSDIGDTQADSDRTDAGDITSLTQLAEALEMPIEDLKGTLQHTFKAAGKEHTVTLAELEKGYQLQADYDRSKTKLADQRKAFESEQQTRIEEYQRQANALATQFNMVEQFIRAEYETQELARLRQDDPAEWNARITEGNQKLNQLYQARQQAAVQYDQIVHQEQQEFLKREAETLKKDVEGWGEEKLKSALGTIKTLGFNDEETAGLLDSRVIKGALELAALREENKALKARFEKAGKTVKKVKDTIPKTLKPGKTGNLKQSLNRSEVSNLKKRLKKSGSTRDAAKMIELML